MENFLSNYSIDEISYFVNVLDKEILFLDNRCSCLRDLKDEFTTYLSHKKEE